MCGCLDASSGAAEVVFLQLLFPLPCLGGSKLQTKVQKGPIEFPDSKLNSHEKTS